ncbi:MAG: hypothetical protein NUV31_03315 [Dehalococcoidales bacterium]|jgi:hypothetical protein|nr:hypothetical protein [Dehalococcoidales bacterium]
MYKRWLLLLTLAVLAISLVIAGCSGSNEAKNRERAEKLAYTTVTNEPTFVFDGIKDSLKLLDASKLPSGDGWVFTYTYNSSHAGYGDRTGMVVAEVITPHTAVITVQNYRVVSAVMDGRWDMILQKIIE